MSELPKGWVITNLGDIAVDIQGGGTPSKSVAENFSGDIPFMTVKDMKTYRPSDTQDKITEKALQSCSSKLIPAGTPIVCTRMGLGKIATTDFPTAINQDLKAIFLERHLINTKFFEYWYRSIFEKINSLGTGTTVKGITLKQLQELKVPLPPIDEQARIDQKLDQLLAQANTLKARVDSIPNLLKRFRQSVLTAAVSGQLTDKWRIRDPLPPRKRLEELFEIVSGLAFKKEQYSSNGSRLLQIANVGYGHTIWESTNHIPNSLADLEEKFKLQANDIVMALNRPITNGILKTAKITPHDLPAILYQRVARFRQNKKTAQDLNYIFLCFRTEDFKKQIEKELQGSDQPYINTSSLRKLEVYFPQPAEQSEIVRRVEQLFAFADQLEAKVATAQARIDRLTQSILAKAFRGELVPQDPNDEPASVLLERIRAQRAAAPKAKRGRKTSA